MVIKTKIKCCGREVKISLARRNYIYTNNKNKCLAVYEYMKMQKF